MAVGCQSEPFGWKATDNNGRAARSLHSRPRAEGAISRNAGLGGGSGSRPVGRAGSPQTLGDCADGILRGHSPEVRRRRPTEGKRGPAPPRFRWHRWSCCGACIRGHAEAGSGAFKRMVADGCAGMGGTGGLASPLKRLTSNVPLAHFVRGPSPKELSVGKLDFEAAQGHGLAAVPAAGKR